MPLTRSTVTKYRVSIRPFQVAAGGLSTQKRVIHLEAAPQGEPPVAGVFLEFHEGPVPTMPGNLVGQYLMQSLALAEFSDMYRVLQTESPVVIEAYVRDDGTVTRFRLGAEVPEPPGEGVAGDTST